MAELAFDHPVLRYRRLVVVQAIGQEAMSGNPIATRLDIDDIFASFRRDPKHSKRMPLVAAKYPPLAEQVFKLLKKA